MLFSTKTKIGIDAQISDGDLDDMAEFIILAADSKIHVGEFATFEPPKDCRHIDSVRGLNDGRVLLVGMSKGEGWRSAAWIVDWSGEVSAQVEFADENVRVVDVLKLRDGFVVLLDEYHRRYFGDSIPDTPFGVRAYNFDCKLLHKSEFWWCDVGCVLSPRQYLFEPDDSHQNGFCRVTLQGTDVVEERIPIPEVLESAHAITFLDEHLYIWRSFQEDETLFKWKIGSNDVTRYTEIPYWLNGVRGLSDGRFLHVSDDEVTVWYIDRLQEE